jgi:hypothetical protein
MPNLRIVSDNAADRSTLTASTTAGLLAASNLLSDIKSQVWRSTGTSATLTLSWPTAETISMVALPFCSLTASATIRVRGYSDGGATLLFDTSRFYTASNGTSSGQTAVIDKTAAAYVPPTVWDWGSIPLGVNAYAHSGAAYGCVWFAPYAVKTITVDIVDTSNPLGYIEAGRIVAGNAWSPANNAQVGVVLTAHDNSVHTRTDAGELRTDRGAQFKGIVLSLNLLPPSDRNTIWNMVRGNGMARPMYFSLTPESTDSAEEQTYQLFGKLTKNGALTYRFVGVSSTALELEEI